MPFQIKIYKMKHATLLKFLLFIGCVVVASCHDDDHETFDVTAAQRQIAGIWNCIDDAGQSYQITVEAGGVTNIHIKNLCEMGTNVIVNALLLDKQSLLIPLQNIENCIIDGTGVISDGFQSMTLELNFNDGVNGGQRGDCNLY